MKLYDKKYLVNQFCITNLCQFCYTNKTFFLNLVYTILWMVEKKLIERITEMTSSKTVCRYLYLILLPCLIAFYLNMYWLASAVKAKVFWEAVQMCKHKNFSMWQKCCVKISYVTFETRINVNYDFSLNNEFFLIQIKRDFKIFECLGENNPPLRGDAIIFPRRRTIE